MLMLRPPNNVNITIMVRHPDLAEHDYDSEFLYPTAEEAYQPKFVIFVDFYTRSWNMMTRLSQIRD